MYTNFRQGNLKERDHLEYLGKESKYPKIRLESVDEIYLAQDRDLLWALANMIMYFQIPQNARNVLAG